MFLFSEKYDSANVRLLTSSFAVLFLIIISSLMEAFDAIYIPPPASDDLLSVNTNLVFTTK